MAVHLIRATAIFSGLLLVIGFLPAGAGQDEEGGEPKFKYEDFEKAGKCEMCHKEITREWRQSMMAQSFTHEWDEIEYFKLALPHALSLEKVAGVKSGCIACHAPLAYLTGDIPPKPPAEGTRANEGVTCDICHCITGSTEEEPFNFSYEIKPGMVKYGTRKDSQSPMHLTKYSEFIGKPELCACCHDEQSPYGAWVKSTYREWKAGPYAAEGTRCHDCHMHYAPGTSAPETEERPDIAHHTFQGSHFPSKLAGAVDLAVYTHRDTVNRGRKLTVRVQLFNGKAGHCIPSGSSEERMVWLEVTARDAAGKTYRLPVDRKFFEGEEFTIADPGALAYQAMGEIMGKEGFKGVSRDGYVPAGCRIFRRPFFDPKGRMTICQWYTAENEKIDYRIGPRQMVKETYTFPVPKDAAAGTMKIAAKLYYAQVPSSVGEFLGLPKFEYAPIIMNAASVKVDVW